LSEPGYYGTGMAFLPKDTEANEMCRQIIRQASEERGMPFLGFRTVPVNPEGIGSTALSVEPEIVQFFVSRPEGVGTTADFERKLFILRRLITKKAQETPGFAKDLYIASLSCKVIVYKGQLTTYQVGTYFPDLSDERVTSAFGLVHSRFSTNTFPSWQLAQPFRMLAHNGEINTLTGNLNWFYAGLRSLSSPYFTEEEMEIVLPVVDGHLSDSAGLDTVAEHFLLSGRSVAHSMLMMVPKEWDGHTQMDQLKKAFYEYHATLMEPWDGPAALCFTD